MKVSINLTMEPIVIPVKELTKRNIDFLNGVYVMFDVSGICIYVGKTTNLYVRISGHRRMSDFYRELDYLHFYEMVDEFKKDILETYLINEKRPLYNKQKLFFMQSEYDSMIEDIDEEIEYLSSELKYREYYLYTEIEERYPNASDVEMEYAHFSENQTRLSRADRLDEERELSDIRNRLRILRDRKRVLSIRKSG